MFLLLFFFSFIYKLQGVFEGLTWNTPFHAIKLFQFGLGNLQLQQKACIDCKQSANNTITQVYRTAKCDMASSL